MPDITNLIIEDVSRDTLKVNFMGEVSEIRNELAALKALLINLKVQNVQYADKIYNIEHVNEANFGFVTSKHLFNGILTKELILLLNDKPSIQDFLNGIPIKDRDNWESLRFHLKKAQSLLGDSFVWLIGWELRRLFAIGNDHNKSISTKIEEYIDHCFSAYRFSLQLVNFIFLSRLWDEKKKQTGINTKHEAIQTFFLSKRILKLEELRNLLINLIEVFKENDLELPLGEHELGEIEQYFNPDSAFSRACKDLENLDALDHNRGSYGLGHCHTAELTLAIVLKTFHFFTDYHLITMKKVEYEETRTTTPVFIKDFSILAKKDTQDLQRILKYDNKPSLTYVVSFRNAERAINLFPFVLDFNSLTNEQDFEIYLYECSCDENGLQYFSANNESEEIIYYRALAKDPRKIKNEDQKNEDQKNMRLDLVIQQFEAALNDLLELEVRFKPLGVTVDVQNLDNI